MMSSFTKSVKVRQNETLLQSWVTVLTCMLADGLSFMPGGEEGEKHLYEKVEPNSMMLHCMLAVMYASTNDTQETVRDASVMGFVFVTEVDEKRSRIKVLAPMNTKIVDRPLIWGSWPEASLSLIG